MHVSAAARGRRGRLLLLLVIHKLDVVLGYLLILLQQELLNLVADVALHDDLLAARGYLGDRGARSKLLAQLLGDLFQVEAKGLEADDGGDELLLVTLDALDGDDAVGQLVGLLRLGCLGFGGLLLRVLGGALLRLDG